MPDPLTLTLIILGLLLLGLLQDFVGPEVVMLTGVLALVVTGVLQPKDAYAGFANDSVITIAALYVVGAGLRSTGALEYISRCLLGRPTPQTSLLRLLAPVSLLSAFMNNTPLVAFFMPVFVQFAKRIRVSPSKLLIPLSYSAILGGTVTLIGTSTNLSVDSFLRKKELPPLGMFELTPIGIVIAVVGLLYLVTIGKRLLPDRQDLLEYMETHPREYSVEMLVQPGCSLIDQSVRVAGLRDLPGLYLYRIDRGLTVITPVDPREVIKQGDILSFSGMASTVVDLQKIRNLDPVDHRLTVIPEMAPAPPLDSVTPCGSSPSGSRLASSAATSSYEMSLDSFEGISAPVPPPPPVAKPLVRQGRQLCEVVISATSPLVGQSIKDADFRTKYHASVIAVHRSGEKLQQKIGQIVLRAGDTLLVDADLDFVRRWKHSPDFILVTDVEDSAPVAHERTWIALAIFVLVVLGMSFSSSQHTPIIAMCGAMLMMITRCVRGQEGMRAIDLSILALVASSIGLSTALETSGAAQWLAHGLLGFSRPLGPVFVLMTLYLLTVMLSELLSNNATALLMAQLALKTAAEMGIDPRPFIIGVTIAASCAFATPIGYQTNLMVLNAGGYRTRDYMAVGIPLNILCAIIASIIIPLVWRFQYIVP